MKKSVQHRDPARFNINFNEINVKTGLAPVRYIYTQYSLWCSDQNQLQRISEV